MSRLTNLSKHISSRLSLLHTTTRSLSSFPSIPTLGPHQARTPGPIWPISHFARARIPGPEWSASHLSQTRTRVTRSGNAGPGTDRPPTEMAPLFPGCDYKHWLIVMDKPGGESASKQQMIDCYVQTLAKVLGSEEEAKMKIYNVSCERYFGFGCEVEEEIANKMEDFPGVLFVLPDSYVDPENQDYGAELFVNGEIVQRSPERQRRVEPQPQRDRHRPSSPRPRRRM